MKILHAAAELFPYVKVGGLADVMAALPLALCNEGMHVRLLLPGYPALMDAVRVYGTVAEYGDLMGGGQARLLAGEIPGTVPVYLLDAPGFFDRSCGPYEEWGDSHRRFAAFAWVAAQLALGGDGEGFRPDILHVHDWQAALAPAYVKFTGWDRKPAIVLNVHNLAYQGIYPRQLLDDIWLPRECFHMNGAEYFGQINYLKAGLAFADRIVTVSPTYAKEIQSREGGYTLDGMLRRRGGDLVGILNGVDEVVWNPAKDQHLRTPFSAKNLKLNKGYNKKKFQEEMGLAEDAKAPLFGVVSRFDAIKGLDLLVPNMDYMASLGAQLAVIGRGDQGMEAALRAGAERHPGSVAIFTGHDEGMAHRLMAASDVLLVPSRSEPCGLTQMYAMRYGALPLARRVGGLADTIVDASPEAMEAGTATGFLFFDPSSWVLGETITRAVSLYRGDPAAWRRMQASAMSQHFTWARSAQQYVDMYRGLAW
jgi:starch synthase